LIDHPIHPLFDILSIYKWEAYETSKKKKDTKRWLSSYQICTSLNNVYGGILIMAVYFVSYKLSKTPNYYNALHETLQSYEAWMYHQDTTLLLYTKESSKKKSTYKLKPCIDDEDSLLIFRVRNDKEGWLAPESWEWINSAFDTKL
jgi:hypothetical protein